MIDKRLSVSIVRSMDQIATLQREWETLFEASSAGPCASYEWFANVALHMQPTNDLRVCVVRDSQGTVGIIPLYLRRRLALGVLPITTVMIADRRLANECPVLLAERAHGMPVVQAALEKLYHADEKWACCRMTNVLRTSALVSSSNGNATGVSQISSECQATPSSIVLELPHSVEEYRESLSRSFRRNISRQIRGLEREGKVELVRLGLDASQSEDGIAQLVEDSISVSQRSWQGELETGAAISSPRAQRFFADVVMALSRKGMSSLSVLYVGSKPVSFDWAVTRRGRMSGLKRGFDPDFRQWGPGIVHFSLLIEDSIERGMTEIDCGNEFRSYKSKWVHKEEQLCTVHYYSPGLAASVMRWWRLRCLRNDAKRSLVQGEHHVA